jgi:hypothetical protein
MLAESIGAARDAWERFVSSERFLARLAASFATDSGIADLARWWEACGDERPASLDAWLAVLRRCSAVPARAFGPEEAASFLLDRVVEEPAASPIHGTIASAAAHARPGRRVVGVPSRARRFLFPRPVAVASFGERGEHLAALLADGRICVDRIASGGAVLFGHEIEPEEIEPTFAVIAVSDTLRCVLYWRGFSERVHLFWFGEGELREEEARLRDDGRIGYRGYLTPSLAFPDTLLELLACQPAETTLEARCRRWPTYGSSEPEPRFVRAELGLAVTVEASEARLVDIDRPTQGDEAAVWPWDEEPIPTGWTVAIEAAGLHLVVRDPQGACVAEWWSPQPLSEPRLLSCDVVEAMENDRRIVVRFELAS